MEPTNPYCQALGIRVPSLEAAAKSPDANFYSLLIAVLLEHGGPVTLEQAARRFETAGLGSSVVCLRSLKRCKPARAPIYRDGDLYALDPHDHDADLWAFRLGLRPAKVSPMPVLKLVPEPLPELDRPLSPEQLAEAWEGGRSGGWSMQRLAICVLDAHGGVMRPAEVAAFLRSNGWESGISADDAQYWRAGAPVQTQADGTWRLEPGHPWVRSARVAVRQRIEAVRRMAPTRCDPDAGAAIRERVERERAEHGTKLASMSRVIVHAFPAKRPQAVVLLDVGQRTLVTLSGSELADVAERLAAYDMIVAVQVRELLRALGFEHGERRIAELGPPQKTMTLNRAGRTLKITNSLLVQGTCGIGRPFGDAAVLQRYLDDGDTTKLRRRLEADAKSLFALYQYGRLHGQVRVHWGFLNERLSVPWVHWDEERLFELMKRSRECGVPLEMVVGSAPGWESPWARAQLAYVVQGGSEWAVRLVDERGYEIFQEDVQAARLADTGEGLP